jgi:hypothetical protein
MSGGHEQLRLAWNPYHFHSTPGLPDYPEAVAAVEEVRRGDYQPALQSSDPEVRAQAAYLLAALDRGGPAITAALAREKDELVRCTFTLALYRLELPPPLGEGLEYELAAAHRQDGELAALERLALRDAVDEMRLPFASGDVASIGLMALMARRETRREEIIAVLWRVLEARLARGERILQHRVSHLSNAAPRTPITSANRWSVRSAKTRLRARIEATSRSRASTPATRHSSRGGAPLRSCESNDSTFAPCTASS